jgi:hypothetical protein
MQNIHCLIISNQSNTYHMDSLCQSLFWSCCSVIAETSTSSLPNVPALHSPGFPSWHLQTVHGAGLVVFFSLLCIIKVITQPVAGKRYTVCYAICKADMYTHIPRVMLKLAASVMNEAQWPIPDRYGIVLLYRQKSRACAHLFQPEVEGRRGSVGPLTANQVNTGVDTRQLICYTSNYCYVKWCVRDSIHLEWDVCVCVGGGVEQTGLVS